jgi:hypothetical protein
MSALDLGPLSGAWLSQDGRYRYSLWRRWGSGDPLTFVMLNPSTADATTDDPTIRRCIGFAKTFGYEAVRVMNLFALRATDPKELARTADPIGPQNDDALAAANADANGWLIAAWGAHPFAQRRARDVAQRRGIRWRALGVTKDGSPRHPLYVRADAPLIPWPAPSPRPPPQGWT